MATAPTALLSIDEYLRTSYSPDVDFVDGEIEERNLGEYEHAKIQTLLAQLFMEHEEVWGTDVLVEQRIRVSATRVRIADVVLLGPEAPFEKVTVTPPLLCIEVLSPEDRLSRAELVMADYRAMGVPHIWLIDPLRQCAYTFGPGRRDVATGVELAISGTPVVLDLAKLFARLDAAISRRQRLNSSS